MDSSVIEDVITILTCLYRFHILIPVWNITNFLVFTNYYPVCNMFDLFHVMVFKYL